MFEHNTESLVDLEKGIKQLLLEDHYSFSEKDIHLLKQCLELLQSQQQAIKQAGKPDPLTLAKVLEGLFKVFTLADLLKDLF